MSAAAGAGAREGSGQRPVPCATADELWNLVKNKCGKGPLGSSPLGGAESVTGAEDTVAAATAAGNCSDDHASRPPPSSSDDSDDEDDDDDVVDELPQFKSDNRLRKARHSVSAEVYGEWNRKEDFKPPVHPKTDAQNARLRAVLAQSFLFQSLDSSDLATVIATFKEVSVLKGVTFIQQGDDGDALFVIESGTVDVFKAPAGTEKPGPRVTVMKPGDTVGELALLYNAPRAATCVAAEDCVFWALDRLCFNHIVRDAAAKRRELYESFLAEVPLLKGMDPYDRSKLGDALKTVEYTEGDYIIRQGEEGDTFFIIVDGAAEAEKNGKIVLQYGRGDFFGELALRRDQPRAASVVARGPVKCVSLDRHSFKRLLGPVDQVMERQACKYGPH